MLWTVLVVELQLFGSEGDKVSEYIKSLDSVMKERYTKKIGLLGLQ